MQNKYKKAHTYGMVITKGIIPTVSPNAGGLLWSPLLNFIWGERDAPFSRTVTPTSPLAPLVLLQARGKYRLSFAVPFL